jgi:tight adherence protein C
MIREAFAAAAGLAIGLAVYGTVSAEGRVASRLGMRGLVRRRAIAENPIWAQIEPVVRWLGLRASGLVTDGARARIDRKLGLAGDWLGISAEEYVALSILSALFGALFGLAFGALSGVGSVVALAAVPIFAAMPHFLAASEAQKRAEQVHRGLPFTVDVLSLSMSAGLDLPGAIRQVVERASDPRDALVVELVRILQELGLGRTRRQALEGFAARVPTAPVAEFVNAVVQAEERGNPLADVLRIQASVSRNRRSVRAEELAAKAGVKLVAPLFLLFGCIMLLIVAPIVLRLAATFE